MKRNGRAPSGAQRWRCRSCGASATHSNDVAARELAAFVGWLLSRGTQADMPGRGRTFRRRAALFWPIWPMPEVVDEVFRVVYVDGIWIARDCVVLIACSDEHVLSWHLARAETTAAWRSLLSRIAPPDMVVTDSQAFAVVSKIVPEDIPLTSFSILMARCKGFLETAVRGAARLKTLKDGDRVLISEGCTHHRQCNDIGTVKLPGWLTRYTGAQLTFETSSGTGFPEDLSGFAAIVHCGGCMLSAREMRYRMKCALDQNIPFTNYGVAIACMNGILPRSLAPFPALLRLLDET